METAIRFSQNSPSGSNDQRFLSADVTNKSFKLCRITSPSSKASPVVRYETLASSTKVPPFRAFDWHPHPEHENLVAVGQSSGEATLLSIVGPDQPDPGSISFQVRSQRPCNAVSLSSGHLLAAGLDRVRTDFCLNVWDFSQRLSSSSMSSPSPKSPSSIKGFAEPLQRLASGDAITSLKFFPTSPLHLIAGSKTQWIRLYDLREANAASNTGLQFNTRCVHNLAIDPRDENFIASCFPTGGDPSIALWDRRMIARTSVTSTSYAIHEGRQPESSLELSNAIDTPANIWSLRFSKSKRGCLGVLSSTGQIKVYELGKDAVVEEYRPVDENESEWEVQLPQEVFLDRSQDLEKPYTNTSGKKDEKSRVVCFDFTTWQDKHGQPGLITLSGNGEIRTTATSPIPEPTVFHPAGFIMHANTYFQGSLQNSSPTSFWQGIEKIKSRAELLTPQGQEATDFKARSEALSKGKSSFEVQSRQEDLGFREITTTIPDLISLTSIAQARCEAGYMLDPTINKSLTGNNRYLNRFWSWCKWAQQLHTASVLNQDNLDLSYLGVYSIWMEDLPASELATRSLGPSQVPATMRLSKAIEGLVRRLQLPAIRHITTEYHFNRQLCLYISNLAWGSNELESWAGSLTSRSQHSKAAFLALVSGNRDLAIRSLQARGSNQTHHFIALAISTNTNRARRPVSTQDQHNLDSDEDSSSDSLPEDDQHRSTLLASALATTTDPFARALLTYLSKPSWPSVLAQSSTLPIRYRLTIALRHLDDSALTTYIGAQTKAAMQDGDLEGIYFTGLGSNKSFELLQGYVARFGDLQTAVCALATTMPRYVREETLLRKYQAMRQTYRHEVQSWGGDFMFRRVAFDVECTRAARDNVTGQKLMKAAPPQIRLVCQGCASGLAHHEAGMEDEGGGNGMKNEKKGNPLSPATAAALGTVCPRCGRKMPRCGVCDGHLGQEDSSFMKWYGREGKGSVDGTNVSERMAGSVGTIVGLDGRKERDRDQHGSGSKASYAGSAKVDVKSATDKLRGLSVETPAVVDAEDADIGDGQEETMLEELRRRDDMMARFIVVCVNCNHGFHFSHARKWFEGDVEAGTQPHPYCPVPKCDCLCWEDGL
ncbi:uncharacterized protein HMPREF1541_00166 [Cyphellophora europaea CBS 101466]|uniref:GATOR2 complex protein MIO zinc-ribbon like domain-containing protein n=1 Tax=Cyphellophora europaea (strain CBS 101466) TaxID=1220924 RepID=W2SDL7_CYPE1|nr:uncharacterized protein HMPREF1541_00166 [Cyphellophora europaea CBS 101466]ETN45984.1 hypothetical protein HMPREF1541_00166 [Cyphellophora europaea CBS 101466]